MENRTKDQIIVFVCEHGAAKSVMAAAYFNKLAEDARLGIHAIARGTNPDPELSPNTIAGLLADGVNLVDSIPQKLSYADLESAQRIVSFCELPEEYQNTAVIERWEDVPAVSQDYVTARDTILEHIRSLMGRL